jgi:amino acid transporter
MAEPRTKLKASLGLGSVVLFGLAYLTPMIVLGTWGPMAETSQGSAAASYLLAAVAVLLTAVSYGVMSRIYPVAGSAYSYTRKSLNAHLGFLVGWAILLDYFFLPMVIWLIGTAYLASAFPAVPEWAWVLGFIVLTTGINILGVAVAEKVNLALMIVQFGLLILFVILALMHVAGSGQPLVSAEPFTGHGAPLSASIAGAALAAYSFLGFDAVSTLTEETREAQRTMPRAILIIAVSGGAIFCVTAYVAQLAHPGFDFASLDSAGFELAREIGGEWFVTLFVATLVASQFAAGIAAQASVGRLLYAMGRDGVLPRRIFGRLHPRFGTPVLNLALVGVVGLAALGLDVTTSTSFINFGAFLAFVLVNLSVVALWRRRHPDVRSPVAGLIVPVLAALADLYLLISLDTAARVLGLVWLCLGVIYLTGLTRFFRRPPPEMEFAE